jgi:hypothetical protein
MSIEAMKQALEALDAYSWEQVNAARAALRTAIEQAEKQEPVCEVLNERGEVDYISYVPSVGTPLYTAPRKWQGLTDEEIGSLWDGHVVPVFGKNGINPIVFARAIEAKLREKNT